MESYAVLLDKSRYALTFYIKLIMLIDFYIKMVYNIKYNIHFIVVESN